MSRLRLISSVWLPVLLWMTLIFWLSTDAGSYPNSLQVAHPILRWLFPHLSEEAIHGVVNFLRKCAHLCEYAVLALLLWRAWQQTLRRNVRLWHGRAAALALVLSVLYAASDEFHQAFVPSREGCVRDVLLDSVGASLGLVVAYLFCAWSSSRQARASEQARAQ